VSSTKSCCPNGPKTIENQTDPKRNDCESDLRMSCCSPGSTNHSAADSTSCDQNRPLHHQP
jgi:hypothetical protein